MPFFVVGRDPENDQVSLVSGDVFATRKDAMKALSNTPPETVLEFKDREVFLVDLKQAAAVIMVAPGGKSAEDVEAEMADAPAMETDAPVEEPASGGLADALARAADALESEGITPPDSVGPEKSKTRRLRSPFPEFEPEADTGPLVDQAAPDLGLAEPLLEDDAMVAPADESPAAASWPWEGQPPAAASGPLPESAQEEDAVAVEDDSDIEAVIEALDETPEEPVVEVAAETEEEEAPAEAEVAEAITEEEALAEAPSLEEDEDSLIRALGDEATLEAAGRAVIMGDYGDDLPNEPASVGTPEVAPESSPEASTADSHEGSEYGGSGYTCDQCVYESTCPKAHDANPDTCGSFQWKAL